MKITHTKYASALVAALAEKKDPKEMIENLIKLLQKRKQFRLLPKIIKSFEEQWLAHQGVVKMNVIYPKKFESALDELQKALSAGLGKKIDINAIPSDNIIGGYKVKISDTLIDASVSGNLKRLADGMRSS